MVQWVAAWDVGSVGEGGREERGATASCDGATARSPRFPRSRLCLVRNSTTGSAQPADCGGRRAYGVGFVVASWASDAGAWRKSHARFRDIVAFSRLAVFRSRNASALVRLVRGDEVARVRWWDITSGSPSGPSAPILSQHLTYTRTIACLGCLAPTMAAKLLLTAAFAATALAAPVVEERQNCGGSW